MIILVIDDLLLDELIICKSIGAEHVIDIE